MSECTHGKSPDEQGRIVREGYDNIAEEYTKDRDKFDNDQEIQEFIDHLPKGAVVLDIGCGGGVPVLKTLIDQGYDAVDIDFSSGMLEVAKKHVPQAT
ncbi:MAG: class I SAM-dependent methyltransferase, partial [Candidatus Bathyarchaeota archaeon]